MIFGQIIALVCFALAIAFSHIAIRQETRKILHAQYTEWQGHHIKLLNVCADLKARIEEKDSSPS